MRRIKIDIDLIRKVDIFNSKLFTNKKTTGHNPFVLPKKGLIKLFKDASTTNDQRKYIKKIFKEYLEILNLKPSEFDVKKREFDRIYVIDGIKKSTSTIFGKKVIEALRYDAYRDSQYPEIITNLGWNLKACFYCNYAGTLTVKKETNYKAYYDLDHVNPKSMYPFLATSFFNFIPCCASCNRSKSNQVITNLNPFYESIEINKGLNKIFTISKKSKIQFYANSDKDKIEILVSDQINNISKTDLDKIVDLKLLYNAQKHEAEEILWKKKVYSKAYLKLVQSTFSGLKLNKHQISRIIWGTDLNENTINDRPLAKFKFDLINDK